MNKVISRLVTAAMTVLISLSAHAASTPVDGMLERIDKGLSKKLKVVIKPDTIDYFELSQDKNRPCVTANNYVSAAVGVNHYLKYTAGVHLSWNCMTARLPKRLPAVAKTERHSTRMSVRYYLNYCTHSYSMAFWDEARWQREIDWMALHGLNMPLCIAGTDMVWFNVLKRLGYTDAEAREFVAGPAFQAWWLMNNLEGWGGPMTDRMLQRNADLQRFILGELRAWGMKPVLPGYSGMVPHDAAAKLGLPVADPGLWCGYNRPAFLSPDSKEFGEIAGIYYEELHKQFGSAPYYSMDPFHEGGNTRGVDLAAAGRAILGAMKKENPQSAWLVQAWGGNPRTELIAGLPADDVVVLDLHVETVPQWKTRKDNFCNHPWLYCMLLNFGGNVGMHGKIDWLVTQFFNAEATSPTLKGIGLTMEGIENNPVMYELMCELPWLDKAPERNEWLGAYAAARYGKANDYARRAWLMLGKSIYNAPESNRQQGTHESVFCTRPSDTPKDASTWCYSEPYYDGNDVIQAAQLMLEAAPELSGNDNYLYDLVDVTRQAVAEKARMVSKNFAQAATKEEYEKASRRFLELLDVQDSLLASRPEFMVGSWIESARSCGADEAERDLYEYNARVQITTWGLRQAADRGALHDYSNREWNGLLADYYAPRWRRWFEARLFNWGKPWDVRIDYYAMEEPWTKERKPYASKPYTDPVKMARRALQLIGQN